MKKLVACALLGLAACGTASGVTEGTPMLAPVALDPPPIYSLLGYRTELELTSAQVESLDSIARAVSDDNAGRVGELRERAMATSRSRGMIPVTSDVLPVVEEVRERNRQAALAVQEVLDETQEAEVCRLFRPDRDRRRGARQDAPPPGRRRVEGDSLLYAPAQPWPWCAAPAPAAGAASRR